MDIRIVDAIDALLTCADAAHMPDAASVRAVTATWGCVRRCFRPCALDASAVNTAACCSTCVDECVVAPLAASTTRNAWIDVASTFVALLAFAAALVYKSRAQTAPGGAKQRQE